VPATPRLALIAPRPNPTDRDLTVSLSLPDAAPAQIEVLDLAGRRVVVREVGSLGLGNHVVNLSAGRNLPAGVYLVRLTQGEQAVTTRAVVVK
jgi:hypothetical protein